MQEVDTSSPRAAACVNTGRSIAVRVLRAAASGVWQNIRRQYALKQIGHPLGDARPR